MEIVNVVIGVISAVAAIISAIAAVRAVTVAKRTLAEMKDEQEKGLDRQKKQATLDAYNVLQAEVFDKINTYMPAQIRDIAQDRKSQEYKEISGYLARIEHFCVGLETEIYDYETFYKIANGYFNGPRGMLYNRLIPMLETKGDGANQDYFANIHAVWAWMEQRSKEEKK